MNAASFVLTRWVVACCMTALLNTWAMAAEPGASDTAKAQNASAATPVAQDSSTANSDDDLTFFDSSAFDTSLADELAKHPDQAVIVPSGPFGPNQIPPRLEKWLAEVSKTGGSVKLKRETAGPPTRGILSDVVDMSVKSHEEAQLSAMYAHAHDYNVLIIYDGNDVKSVHFIKRPTANN